MSCVSIGQNRGGLGGVGIRPLLTKGGGVTPISRRKGGGGGSIFLSWEKEFIEESSVKPSILPNFVDTKDQKSLKLTLAIYLDLFLGLREIFRDLG
jgi:hypothetical protein